jgi:hypothetical protein
MRRTRASRPLHGGVRRLPAGSGASVSGRSGRRDRGAEMGGRQCDRAGRECRAAGRRGQQRRRHPGRMPGARCRGRVAAAGRVPVATPAGARRSRHRVESRVSHQPGFRQRGSGIDVALLPGHRHRITGCRPGPTKSTRWSANHFDHVRGDRSLSRRSGRLCVASAARRSLHRVARVSARLPRIRFAVARLVCFPTAVRAAGRSLVEGVCSPTRT